MPCELVSNREALMDWALSKELTGGNPAQDSGFGNYNKLLSDDNRRFPRFRDFILRTCR